MMGCWRRRLGIQALQREAWAAVVTAKGRQPLREGERSRLSFQVSVSRICSGQPQQQEGTLFWRKRTSALPWIRHQDLRSHLFSSCAKKGDESEGQAGSCGSGPSSPATASPPDSTGQMGSRRKRAWARSLSPLERVSRLVPEEFVSPEIRAMRSTEGKESMETEAQVREKQEPPFTAALPQAESQMDTDSVPKTLLNTSNKNIPFQVGDLILAEIRRKRFTEFKKLSQLTSIGMLNSCWGSIHHAEIIGKLPGQLFRTSTGYTFLIRRPSLEEYVIQMKRGPVISYPKDINTMLLLMDISPGDRVLEVGSGSGGMSLFLSRAAGPQGHILSYEVRKDHHKVAKKNYQRWCDAWKLGHTVEWPDNVDFINENILTAVEDLKTTFDAVALDMLSPQSALPVVLPNLKAGGVCAVYLANITQVIDLMEAIRISKLSFFCERIVDVTHRDWLVLPAAWKTHNIFQNMDDDLALHNENDEVPAEESEDDEVFISNKANPPYIARPYPWQVGHTAFVVKLRKFIPTRRKTAPNRN